MTTVSQAEFARMEGKARSYITALKAAGRLVMTDDGKVNVEASRARLNETADPNREDVKERWQQERTTPEAASQSDKIGNSYQAARADGMKFDAMTKKVMYEKMIGKLVEKEEAAYLIEDVGGVFRQSLENFPHRVSAELVGKSLDAIRSILKQEIHSVLSEVDREFTKREAQLGAEQP